MLQQILNDMYIDPDLLAAMGSEQKQILFCKMREEQVRRWKYHDEQSEKEQEKKPKIPPKPGRKGVKFLLGKDGEPWTWVMGDHSEDKSIESILEEETLKRALIQAEKEDAELRKHNAQNVEVSAQENYNHVASNISSNEKLFIVRNISQEIKQRNHMVESTTDLWLKQKQQKLKEHRVSEIYATIRETQRKADELAEFVRKEQEELWLEREKKAKEAERQIREIARQAREEHKKVNENDQLIVSPRNSISLHPLNDDATETVFSTKHKRTAAFVINNRCKTRPNKPLSKDAVVEWFKKEELLQGSGFDPNTLQIAPWFHGMIGRSEAETLLLSKPESSFLVRLSERIWGYAISYRCKDRCKHFLIEASGNQYQFFGSGHLSHNSLYELVMYHQKRPITSKGQEYLLHPCSCDFNSIFHKEIKQLLEN